MAVGMTPDYLRGVLSNNIERCQDVLWDLKNKDVFDKSDGQILGIIAVCEQMEMSLTALLVDCDKTIPHSSQERQENADG
jgi:hypothetical protein